MLIDDISGTKFHLGLIVDEPGIARDFYPGSSEERVDTPFGRVQIVTAEAEEIRLTIIHRFGSAGSLNPGLFNYRAAVWVLGARKVQALISFVAAYVAQPDLSLDSPILFSDIFFPDNRLPGGEICTIHGLHGDTNWGYYSFSEIFSPSLRTLVGKLINESGYETREGVCGFFPALRTPTVSEAFYFSSLGLQAVARTGVPESVLAGELEIPNLLLGFGVSYLEGITESRLPFTRVTENIESGYQFLGDLVGRLSTEKSLDEIYFDGGIIYRPHQEMV